jgi:hypothetical protein
MARIHAFEIHELPGCPELVRRIATDYLRAVGEIVFDGIVSCLRSYTVAELRELTRGLDAEGYRFHVGQLKSRGQRLTYLLGVPAAPPDWTFSPS